MVISEIQKGRDSGRSLKNLSILYGLRGIKLFNCIYGVKESFLTVMLRQSKGLHELGLEHTPLYHNVKDTSAKETLHYKVGSLGSKKYSVVTGQQAKWPTSLSLSWRSCSKVALISCDSGFSGFWQ